VTGIERFLVAMEFGAFGTDWCRDSKPGGERAMSMSKRFALLVACVMATVSVSSETTAVAATGWLQSYNYTFFTQDTSYTLGSAAGGYPPSVNGTVVGAFNGANLGSYDWSSGSDLFLNSAISAWADGGDTYSNFSLWYRVFSGTGAGSGSFTQVSASSINNIGGNDFRGFATGVNLEQAAEDIGVQGTYTVQAYLSRAHTWSGGGPYTTYWTTTGDTGGVVPTGNYFSATYVATPEPSTYVMAAFAAACCGFQWLRRRRSRT